MEKLLFYFLLFFIYSFMGWLIEVTCCSINQKRFIMRGFLIGPYCPIYGFSSLLMILILQRHVDDIIVLFVMSAFIASLMEYLTSYIMEKKFAVRWWDYSSKKFNLNGRICLENSILFGFLGVLLLLIIHPAILNFLNLWSDKLIIISSSILAIIMLFDTIFSYQVVSKIKLDVDTIYKDYTEIIDQKIWELLSTKSYFRKRILKAFPKLKIKKIK